MAKTKLLADIGVLSLSLNTKLQSLSNALGSAAALDNAHWDALTKIKTDLDSLDQTISKLDARMKTWDGSTKLRDIFKKKAALAKARQDAIAQAKIIHDDAQFIHATVASVVKLMQAVSKG